MFFQKPIQTATKKKKRRTRRAKVPDELMQLAEFEIRIIRTKRKSISLHVKPEEIVIRAPLFIPTLALKAFALSKLNWLRKSRKRIGNLPKAKKLQYVNGETLLFKGEEIQLQTATGKSSSIAFNAHTNTLTVVVSTRVKDSQAFVKKKVAQWYKDETLAYLEEKTPHYAADMDVSYQSLEARDYKARWGSCSATGKLSFNWRILMAPDSVIDSVIVHELAHIKHFNHSKSFWDLVYKHYPEYKQQHEWLKQNQHKLQA